MHPELEKLPEDKALEEAYKIVKSKRDHVGLADDTKKLAIKAIQVIRRLLAEEKKFESSKSLGDKKEIKSSACKIKETNLLEVLKCQSYDNA